MEGYFRAMATYLALLRWNVLPRSACTKGETQIFPVPSESQVAAVDTEDVDEPSLRL